MSEIKYIPVSEVMKPDIRKVDGLTNVKEAIDMMREAGTGSLIIDKRDKKDEYGLISIGDLSATIVARDLAPERVSVYEIMSKPVLSVESDMNIRYAIRLLTRFKISRALVLQDGSAVGIVSLRDMVLRYSL
ncbi:MAG: CBS domain-containing protein [Gammaproteobacteria bacterium]|nr:CBS domain-containing protein [Gammaproteobacteria bacterium]